MSDPVSWLLIEPGWTVVDADGKDVGKVEEAAGERDIFSGIAVATGLFGSPRWVPANEVAEITEGSVRLRLRADQIKRLEAYQEPSESA